METDVLRSIFKGQLDNQEAAANDVRFLVEIPRVFPPDVVVQVLVCFRCGAFVIKTNVLIRQGQFLVFQQFVNQVNRKISNGHQ